MMNCKIFKVQIAGLLLLSFVLASSSIQAQNQPSVIKKSFSFTIPFRGVKTYKITVPKNAKKVSAVISNQTQMVKLEMYGPTNFRLGSNSTWVYLDNWKKPIRCSASVVNNKRQRPGIWTVKVEGAVHVTKLDKIKSVSGVLTIRVL